MIKFFITNAMLIVKGIVILHILGMAHFKRKRNDRDCFCTIVIVQNRTNDGPVILHIGGYQ